MAPLRRRLALVVLGATVLTVACDEGPDERAPAVDIGDLEAGAEALEAYDCGACHMIPGIEGADGTVGPPLENFGERSFIAGQLANTPENLVRWITDPEEVEPGTAMPDLGVTEADARDMAAYLESLE